MGFWFNVCTLAYLKEPHIKKRYHRESFVYRETFFQRMIIDYDNKMHGTCVRILPVKSQRGH